MRLLLLLAPLLVACAAVPAEEEVGASDANLTGNACGESIGDEAHASVQPALTDCYDDMHELKGALSGRGDRDYFKVPARDRKLCRMEPWVVADVQSTEVCMFARCASDGSNAVERCRLGAERTDESGLTGCCTDASGAAFPKLQCPHHDETVDLLFRVQATTDASESACLPYTFAFDF